MESIKVEVLNWDKYNPRKDYKKPWWFALSNRFLEDSQFYHFRAEEKLAWVYILSQASQQSTGLVNLVPEHAERVCGISEKHLLSAISKLNSIGCTRSVQTSNGICTESVLHTTEQTEQNNTNKSVRTDAFDSFYKKYPRKEKKTEASKKYASLMKAGVEPETISQSLAGYLAHLAKKKTDPKFYKLPTTFLGEYLDWLAPDAGTTSLHTAPTGKNWNEMASEAWRYLHEQTIPLPEVCALVDALEEELRTMHRDEFRPHGRVPDLLRETFQRMGAA